VIQNDSLPINWQKLKVQDIISPKKSSLVSGPFGSNIGKRFFVEEGIPLIRGNNLTLGVKKFIDEGFVYITEEKAHELRNCEAKPGDIIFTAAGTLGQVGLIPQNSNYPKYIISNKQLRLRCDTDIAIPEYLYYWFSSSKIRQYIINQNTGASVPLITLGILRNVPVNLPPLPTQRKIAAILSAYDDLIENNARRIAILEEMAQALYREWFVHFRFPGHEKKRLVESELGLIPEGWEVVKIRDISSLINRGISPKYDNASESLVINQRCIRHGRINLDGARRHLTRVSNEKLVTFGDVLVNSTGIGTLGRVAQIYREIPNCTVDSHVTIVRPRDSAIIDYFGFYLQSLQLHFDSLGVGSTGQTELSRESIASSNFLLPSKNVQEAFTTLVSPMRRNVIQMLVKNANLRKTRDLLLPKLISGEVDVERLNIQTCSPVL
jgi:type I restriction enzyme, S subunit